MEIKTLSRPAHNHVRVAELAAKGMYAAQIARELGITRERVRQIGNKYGIDVPNARADKRALRRHIEEVIKSQKLKDLFAQYLTATIDRKEICKELSIPDDEFFPILRRAELLIGSKKELSVIRRKHQLLHQRFGKWTVIGFLDDEDYMEGDLRDHRAICRCDCGAEADVLIGNLIRGSTLSCHACSMKSRQVVPWIRSDSKRFPNTSRAAADAGVTPPVFISRINDGRQFYKSANGFTYTALMDEAVSLVPGYKNCISSTHRQ